MPHFGGAAGMRRDLDDVEAECPRLRRTQRAKVGRARATQDFFLARSDRIVPLHERMGRACLHLDEDQNFAIPAHKVDFLTPVARAAPIARDDGETPLALKKIGRSAFTRRAGRSGDAESSRVGGTAVEKGFEPGKHRVQPWATGK